MVRVSDTVLDMPNCEFHPDAPTAAKTIYRCARCHHATPHAVTRPPLRSCPVNATRRSRPSTLRPLTFACPHRGRHAGNIPCGCHGSTAAYICGHAGNPAGYCTLHAAQPKRRQIERTGAVPIPFTGRLPVCAACRLVDRAPPIPAAPADPVTVLHISQPIWTHRTARFVAAARSLDLSAAAATVRHESDLPAIIRQHRPRVVFCHAFQVAARAVAAAAESNPDIHFLIVFHSSQNHLLYSNGWPAKQREALDLSARLPNVWYATPDATNGLAAVGHPRVVTFPNPFPPSAFLDPPPPERPALLISGRLDLVKGIPAAIIAAGIVQRSHAVDVLTLCRHGSKSKVLRELCRCARVEATHVEWMKPEAFPAFLASRVSIVLQPSLSESFNYLALEAMAAGRPVVGSPAIRYLPPAWQADPNDPEDIALRVTWQLRDYATASSAATATARVVATLQNTDYRHLIDRLTGGTGGLTTSVSR